ncbi:DUF6259 domain-containing protein [Cohnella lubricantis]|uniref:DUF6259 domain-containing protein n=1 Tax=Cohnella lubricantis TaxID=2163172 RepID=A0A841TDV9_9BACL|nr:DUF6259 domain-containing protein [Cohnella lubricantis]MBB6678416.1 hypothetical protein [Cohnella lubricantis]MBP2116796.1 hypothetical protein [Cohnella lubricantis]
MIVLENKRIRLEFSDTDGTIRSLRDAHKGIEYTAESAGSEPFRLETDEGASGAFSSFEWSAAKDECGSVWQVSFTWRTEAGVTVTARAALASEEGEVNFDCRAENGSEQRLHSLEYPIFPNLQAITDEGRDDYAAHPFATGVKVRSPLKHFAQEGSGFRYMPYPESFSGATMQFFCYYGLNRGGLYFAAMDGEGHPKWLNFYKNGSGLLEASFIHGCEDIGPGKGISPPYPVQVTLLEGGGWHEAADRYKTWAIRQKWCSRGLAADRAPAEGFEWLYKEMGVATFGINAGSDRTAWLRKYHEHIGTPMFHVLGPDWTNAPQTFGWGVPGGFDDWFPTRFNADNLAVMKEYGDRYAPFEFDYLYHFGGADGELGRAAAQKFPDNKKSVDAYKFPFLCPAHPYARDFHVRRDAELQRTVGVDAIYYDISANNIMKVCMDDSHGHSVGAGRQIEEAYRRNYADTKAAMAEVAGKYVPMGTEMMNETMLDLIDYYQARAGGQPAAPLELWPVRDLLKTGDAELIPMFAYVYHEYGALRMDGWGKLVQEIGNLYFFTVARTYLWGGLYELNYEYSPMEALEDGQENGPEEHYYRFEPRGYAFSTERAAYLGLYAKLRVGAANKYWAYGRMLKPLTFESERIRAEWFHYNHGKETPEYNDSGALEVDAVVHSAWQFKEESVGLFFANASGETQRVRVRLEPGAYGVNGWAGRLYAAAGGEEPFAGTPSASGELELELPAYGIAMLEGKKA